MSKILKSITIMFVSSIIGLLLSVPFHSEIFAGAFLLYLVCVV